MGIDIYAKWDRMTMQEEAVQARSVLSEEEGGNGYLFEHAYDEPSATKALVPEAFTYGRARIAATDLRERLPEALKAAERRERELYWETDDEHIERILKSYRDFVALCARKEEETGIPCLIVASY
jgi:hypothetical protein